MIFAAGLGTRLKPMTDTMPKALVPVGGRPLLEILIEKLKREGFTDVVINIHHFAQQIVDFVERNQSFGINIRFSDESNQLLETGGGIRHASPMLQGGEPFLVHNVDILSNVNLADFHRAGIANDATLLVSQRDTQRYLLFDDDMRLVGWTNIKTGEVKSPFHDLDVEACRKYAFAGIHTFSPRLFPLMESWPDKFSIIDFYLSACKDTVIKGIVKPDLKLIDVGKLDTLAKAEDFIKTLIANPE